MAAPVVEHTVPTSLANIEDVVMELDCDSLAGDEEFWKQVIDADNVEDKTRVAQQMWSTYNKRAKTGTGAPAAAEGSSRG